MSSFLAIFVIAAIGYLIGGIKIRGVELGTAGVLLAAVGVWALAMLLSGRAQLPLG